MTIEKHDILCLRIGFLQLRLKQSKEQFYKDFNEPGLTYSPELVDWFHKMEIPAALHRHDQQRVRARSGGRRPDSLCIAR